MNRILLVAFLAAGPALAQKPAVPVATKKIQVLIITGRDDHDWRGATTRMRQYLDDAGVFETRVTEEFRDSGPRALEAFDVAVLVYNDKAAADHWTPQSKQTLLDFVHSGKGLVVYHHTSGAFKDWPAYPALSGGNYYGKAQHSEYHDFTVDFVDRHHPITRGLKKSFLQVHDELYANLQMQPEGNYHLLATAWDDHALYHGKSKAPLIGPGRNEPLMWTVSAGKGRVFATMIGHSAQATTSEGFKTTFTRGVEWAATGDVLQSIPATMRETEK